jgi:hypothetical protein
MSPKCSVQTSLSISQSRASALPRKFVLSCVLQIVQVSSSAFMYNAYIAITIKVSVSTTTLESMSVVCAVFS